MPYSEGQPCTALAARCMYLIFSDNVDSSRQGYSARMTDIRTHFLPRKNNKLLKLIQKAAFKKKFGSYPAKLCRRIICRSFSWVFFWVISPRYRLDGSWKFALHSKICLTGAVSTAAEHAGEKLREHQRLQGESQPAQEDRQRLQPHPDQDR